MASSDIIKSLSTVLISAIYKSQQHQEKNSCERRDSNLGGLQGEKQVCYICVMRPSPLANEMFASHSRETHNDLVQLITLDADVEFKAKHYLNFTVS